MSFAGLLPHVCDVQRNVSAQADNYGHSIPDWQDQITNVKCRYMPRTSNLRGIGGLIGEGSSLQYRDLVKNVGLILVPPDVLLTEADRIANIRDLGGIVIEAGPLNIILQREAHNGVTRHHRTLVTEKLT